MRKKLLYAFLFILSIHSFTKSQSTLYKIKSLSLENSGGIVNLYYSYENKSQADSLKKILEKSLFYFDSTFGINETFAIAVLDSSDWSKITQIPFGLPFVSGPPYVICFPAYSDNILYKFIISSIKNSDLSKIYSRSDEELAHLFISFIGFHEFGHIYAKKYGLIFPNKWTFEFVATYFAYQYLSENFPLEKEIWLKMSELLKENIKPAHTSLKDFEQLYIRVGVENYAWYQVVFLLKAAEIQQNLETQFIIKFSAINLNSSDEFYSLKKLEKIYSGFLNWAKDYKLIE